jgi:hypothetical protein
MWVFTPDGFISAVDNKAKSGHLTVRARDRKSLETLQEMSGADIEFTPMRDYQYRVYVTKEMFQDFMNVMVDAIEYANFKDELYAVRGKTFARAAGQVWGIMCDVADQEYQDWYADQYASRVRG